MATEKRLIDANALKQKQIKVCFDDDYEGDGFGIVYVRHIDETPTVDAVEVVHGRWKNKQTNSIFTWHLECSVCGADYNTSVGYNYCPNCGARMDGYKNGN